MRATGLPSQGNCIWNRWCRFWPFRQGLKPRLTCACGTVQAVHGSPCGATIASPQGFQVLRSGFSRAEMLKCDSPGISISGYRIIPGQRSPTSPDVEVHRRKESKSGDFGLRIWTPGQPFRGTRFKRHPISISLLTYQNNCSKMIARHGKANTFPCFFLSLPVPSVFSFLCVPLW